MRKLILFLTIVLLTACVQHISDIKDEEHIGKTVTVSGVADNTLKIGSLSGFTLREGNQSIAVRSETLPKEGDNVVVKGLVVRDSLFGFYIQEKDTSKK